MSSMIDEISFWSVRQVPSMAGTAEKGECMHLSHLAQKAHSSQTILVDTDFDTRRPFGLISRG